MLVLFQRHPLWPKCFEHILFNARRSYDVKNVIAAVDSANGDINNEEGCINERNFDNEGADERDLHYSVQENNYNNTNFVPGNGAVEL